MYIIRENRVTIKAARGVKDVEVCLFVCLFFPHEKTKSATSRKHAYIILTPLKPHFYIVKLGFTGVYIILLIAAQKHRLWVLVRTASSRRF